MDNVGSGVMDDAGSRLQKILKRSDESAPGADDFAEFVVILQRISNRKDKKQ